MTTQLRAQFPELVECPACDDLLVLARPDLDDATHYGYECVTCHAIFSETKPLT